MKAALVSGSLVLALALASCNGGGGTNPAPAPSPTATPCVLPVGTSATSSTFAASSASGVNYIVPAIDNTIDTMSAGTLTVGSGAQLTTAIANGTCITSAPPGSTIYQFIAMTAVGSSVTFPTIPGWTFTFPAAVSTSGRTFAFYQYAPSATNPFVGTWTQVLGNGVVAGQNVSFAAGGTGFTLQASAAQGQIFALTSTP